MGEPAPKKSLMRSLGEFVGHIARAVTTDVRPAEDREAEAKAGQVHSRQETHEETVHTKEGKMILRRTIIEEVEIRRDRAGNDPPEAHDVTDRSSSTDTH